MAKLVVCKTCGNDDLTEISEGILKCKYCRHLTERPKENADLLERAHNLRFNSKDFDEAAKIYEEVIRLTPNEAEAYWGRVLCRFGIEYVKDTNGEYLPTCHRTIQSSILDDADYLMAVNKAKGELKTYYTSQAQLIDTYQTKIKVIAAREEPYDVFISFKATDGDGKVTEDSLIAQEIYYYLTKNLGLKVFFSNITLKDKAGQEYEPIIYAALNSATVMVLVGTKNEYINATWVKNEWSRFLGMMSIAQREGKSKYIVTALKGMGPEQLPSTLAAYQAVNIAELGAKEKLCSNIDSLVGDLRVMSARNTAPVTPPPVTATPVTQPTNIEPSKPVAPPPPPPPPPLEEIDIDYDFRTRFAYGDNMLLGIDKNGILCMQTNEKKLQSFADQFNGRKGVKQVASTGNGWCILSESGRILGASHNSGRGGLFGVKKVKQALSDIMNWSHIKYIACGGYFFAGVKDNGTVVIEGSFSGLETNTLAWENIKEISCGGHVIAGLKEDGTAVARGCYDSTIASKVNEWNNIKQLACGDEHVVALLNNGTVVACGKNNQGQCNVSEWKDIAMISANNEYTVALRKDGKLFYCGKYSTSTVSKASAILCSGVDYTITIHNGYLSGTTVGCSISKFNDIFKY